MQTQKYAFIHRYRESQAEGLVEKSLTDGKEKNKEGKQRTPLPHLFNQVPIFCRRIIIVTHQPR